MSAGGQERSSPAADSLPAAYARGPLYVLVALVFLTPLVTANLTALGPALPWLYDAVELPRLVASLLGVLLAGMFWSLGQVRRPAPIKWNWPLAGLAAVAALAIVSAVFALDPRLAVLGQSERLEGVVTLVVYALLFGITLQVVGDSRDVRLLATALVAAAAVSAVYGVAQWLGVDPTSYTIASPAFELERAFATFGNPNFLAGLLVLAVPPAAALASRQRSTSAIVGLWVVVALITLALLLTFTRGALIALGIEVLVFAGLVISGRVALTRSARWGSGLVAGLFVLVATASVGRGGEVDLLARLLSRGGLADRLLGWQAALEAALARPLVGYGPDGFLGAFRLHRPDAYAEIGGLAGTLNNAHSWPLQLAATVGIPAAILFSLAVGYALWLGARAALARGNGVGEPPSDDEGDAGAASGASTLPDPVFVGVWLGCLGYLVHVLGNVAVHGATTPFWILLAAVTVPACRVWRPGMERLAAWRGLAATLVVVTAVAGVASLGLLAADSAYLSSRVAYREQTADPIEPAERAVTLNPLSVKYDRGLAEVVADEYYRLRSGALGSASEQAEASAFARADERYGAMLDRYPNDYAGHAWHAALLASADTQFEAEESRAIEAAARAESLDRHAVQVMPIAEGNLSRSAILKALSVPGLP